MPLTAGVLDALLGHNNDDLTSLMALARMVGPIGKALDSYADRAKAAKKSPEQMIKLEAAVQGW